MTAELRHSELTLKREDVWEVSGKPALVREKWAGSSSYAFDPHRVTVIMTRRTEHEAYTLWGVNVTGCQYKGNGEIGLRHGDTFYTEESINQAPDWVQELAATSLAEAERGRLVDAEKRNQIYYSVRYLLDMSQSLKDDERKAYEALAAEFSTGRGV